MRIVALKEAATSIEAVLSPVSPLELKPPATATPSKLRKNWPTEMLPLDLAPVSPGDDGKEIMHEFELVCIWLCAVGGFLSAALHVTLVVIVSP